MARTTTLKSNQKASEKIHFEYFAPSAGDVKIAGTFNDWKPTMLKKDEEGKWALSLNLKAGRYEYRYLVDGVWQNEQRAVECVPNQFGTWNCVVEVKE